jgi:hypothetical protein
MGLKSQFATSSSGCGGQVSGKSLPELTLRMPPAKNVQGQASWSFNIDEISMTKYE